MGGANEYLLQNRELNYISKGFLWSLWNLLPIAGSIIMIIKILNRIFKSTSSKVLMFIALIIPYVNIASAIVFFMLVFNRIGGKFLIGVLLLPFLIGIFAGISVPQYKAYVERARVTEATSIMGAIITSQKMEKQRKTNYYAIPLAGGVTDITKFRNKGIDISDTKFFTYQTAMIGVKSDDGFTITATTTDDFGAAGGWMRFTYDPTATPTASWTCDGRIILPHKGDYGRAISDYNKALEIAPRDLLALNGKAWLLATCPDTRYRDGVKAMELAKKAVELAPQNSGVMDTLAAAYAEAGRFEDAIKIQEQVIALSKKEGRPKKLIDERIVRLESYKAHRPWREK